MAGAINAWSSLLLLLDAFDDDDTEDGASFLGYIASLDMVDEDVVVIGCDCAVADG